MKARDSFSALLGFAVLAATGLSLFLLIRWLVDRVSTLESQTSSAIIAGGVAVLIAAMGHGFQATWNRRREIEASQRPQKSELYESFIDHWFTAMNIGAEYVTKSRSEGEQQDAAKSQRHIVQKMILWGSDDVIVAYQKWWRIVLTTNDDPVDPELMARLEDVLLAFRRDLGHRNKDIARKDLLGLFLNDIDIDIDQFDLTEFPLKRARSSSRKRGLDSGKRGAQPKTMVGKNPPPAQPKTAKPSTDSTVSAANQ